MKTATMIAIVIAMSVATTTHAKKYDPHVFEAKANWTDKGNVRVSIRIFEANDDGRAMKLISSPMLMIRDGQRGSISIGGDGDTEGFMIDVIKPAKSGSVLVVATMLHGDKVMSAEAKVILILSDAEGKDAKVTDRKK